MKDGVESQKYDGSIGLLTYSPDSKSFAYVVVVDRGMIIVKDGVESQKYSMIHSITYSPDGRSFAYRASTNE